MCFRSDVLFESVKKIFKKDKQKDVTAKDEAYSKKDSGEVKIKKESTQNIMEDEATKSEKSLSILLNDAKNDEMPIDKKQDIFVKLFNSYPYKSDLILNELFEFLEIKPYNNPILEEIIKNNNDNILLNKIILFVKDKLRKNSGERNNYTECFKNIKRILKGKENLKNRKYFIFVANLQNLKALEDVFNKITSERNDFSFKLSVFELIVNNQFIESGLLENMYNYAMNNVFNHNNRVKILQLIVNNKKLYFPLKTLIIKYLNENPPKITKVENPPPKRKLPDMAETMRYRRLLDVCEIYELVINDIFADRICEQGHYYSYNDVNKCPYCGSDEEDTINLTIEYENYVTFCDDWCIYNPSKRFYNYQFEVSGSLIVNNAGIYPIIIPRYKNKDKNKDFGKITIELDSFNSNSYSNPNAEKFDPEVLILDIYLYQKPGMWKRKGIIKELNYHTNFSYKKVKIYIDNELLAELR